MIEKLYSPYAIIVYFVAILRIAELFLSKRNAARLKDKGAFEIRGKHFTTMKLVHTFWLFSCLIEYTFKEKAISSFNFTLFGTIVLLGMTLRYIAISTLGERWTVTIWILPGVPAISHGIYRFIKHPNYLGVILEIIALPLMVQSWFTAIIFSFLNLFVLKVRIPSEEKELMKHSHYENFFQKKSRFIPKVI